MYPISFKQSDTIYIENQPGDLRLPVYESKDGRVISAWRLDWKERLKILFTGVFYHECLTFNQSHQPIRLYVTNPLEKT
jgi:hypothetical protein